MLFSESELNGLSQKCAVNYWNLFIKTRDEFYFNIFQKCCNF